MFEYFKRSGGFDCGCPVAGRRQPVALRPLMPPPGRASGDGTISHSPNDRAESFCCCTNGWKLLSIIVHLHLFETKKKQLFKNFTRQIQILTGGVMVAQCDESLLLSSTDGAVRIVLLILMSRQPVQLRLESEDVVDKGALVEVDGRLPTAPYVQDGDPVWLDGVGSRPDSPFLPSGSSASAFSVPPSARG